MNFKSCLLIIFFSLFYKSRSEANFCKTPQGDSGKCIDSKFCLNSNYECGPGKVCCPMMEKIVIPSSTFVPIIAPRPSPTPPATIRPVPISEATTSKVPTTSGPVTSSKAELKCDEYRHRLKKRASIITYVFGGTASKGREFPHMAILGYGRPEKVDWLCGGSLISEEYVLTAAHCITSKLGDLIRVRLGDLDLQSVTDDASPQDFGISQKISHPKYRAPSQYNDIALIKLNRPVTFNSYISPICLQTSKSLPNTNFVATGWGRTELGGTPSDILMKVDLEYFSNEVCEENYEDVAEEYLSRGIEDDTQICAGSRTQEKDTCQGDSGGPLQIYDNGIYLVGITSFGKACGIPDSPAVYTRVSYFVPWIEQIVWPN